LERLEEEIKGRGWRQPWAMLLRGGLGRGGIFGGQFKAILVLLF